MSALHSEKAGRRRVLLLVGEVFTDGGIQRFNRTLLAACERVDIRCDVLTLNDADGLENRGEPAPSINIRGFNRDKLRFAGALSAAVLFGRYDIVIVGHINLLTLTVAALLPRRFSRPRLLLIAHGIEVWSGIHGRRRHSLMAVEEILCVSHYTARMIQQQAPQISASRFTLFPNALGETWAQRAAVAGDAAAQSGLPARYILSVTRLDRSERDKGLVTTLEAFAQLADRSLHYVIAGRGDDQPYLQQVAMNLKVSERVHFVGSVSDAELAQLYRDCIAFVLPSGKEGFGIVFLEAMFFGAPVIAAAAKGAVDVVQHEATGLLVPYGNSTKLKEAIARVLVDTELRDRLRVAGKQAVSGEGRFTFGAYVQRLALVLAA